MTTGGGRAHWDVVVIGAGLAGLTLARHLLLDTDKRVLLLERREAVPPPRQKVGESTVQLAGYYLSKVLDLEEYLLREHYMKYNLRFYWKCAGRENDRFEDYHKGYIRSLSNVASYQLDRNKLEGDLLRMCLASPRFGFVPSVRSLEVELCGAGLHRLGYRAADGPAEISADWVVDTTGRRRLLAKRERLERPNAIDHGAFFWWVDGLVDVERLTDLSRRERRLKPERRATGHLPTWLATNHFMGPGLWFWVIPLQGKTSLGLVYDRSFVEADEVFSVEKATAWVCRAFPLFARDLPARTVLDFGGYRSFAHDCSRTIDPDRWAITGEAGRFSDPLYSPGSDLISLHNTLIVDAVSIVDRRELAARCQLYEQLMRTAFAAYVPSYATSYDALGDQETFCLKYAWELSIYFAAYVFPFVNDLFTDRRFVLAWLRQMSRLGPLNESVQVALSGYFRWKREHGRSAREPVLFDFREIDAVRRAQETFYQVGVGTDEARRILAQQVASLEELARFILARLSSVVVDDPRALVDRAFVEGIELDAARFEPAEIRSRWREGPRSDALYDWSFDPSVADRFHPGPGSEAVAAGTRDRKEAGE